MLEIKNLYIGYNENQILIPDINLEIGRGEFICFLGPNGLGKTTLLKTISGALNPISGSVIWNGSRVHDLDSNKLASIFSSHFTSFNKETTLHVGDVLKLSHYRNMGIFGSLEKEFERKIEQSIETFNLESLLLKPVNELSDGQLQRVLIARLVAQDTPFQLLDEPTTHLDIESKYEVMSKLKTAVEKNKSSALFTSHDWDIALEYANSLWVCEDGKIKVTTPEEYLMKNSGGSSPGFELKSGRYRGSLEANKSCFQVSGPEYLTQWTEHYLSKSKLETDRKISVSETPDGDLSWVIDRSSKKIKSLRELVDQIKADS